MQIRFKYSSVVLAAVFGLAIACPQRGVAQRFNHGSFSRPAPAARPAAAPRQEARPAQQARPVQEARPAQEARPVQEARPATINGGSRNYGNHNYNRVDNVRATVPVRNNVPFQAHANVYHTGTYAGIHPYYYHPYRPYYWGPHWHPLGFFLTTLASDAIWFNFNNERYYYDDGCYYLPSNGGYSVVPPPIGAVVPTLPDGYETTMVGNDTYYYFGGAFYIQTDQGYQVVVAPPGAVITELPTGAVDEQVNGEDILVYDNTYYQPITQDGQDAYEVVPGPGQ